MSDAWWMRFEIFSGLKSKHKMIEDQNQAIHQYMHQKEEFDGYTQRMWHDMKHHLAYIRSVADGREIEITKYIDEIYENMGKVLKVIATGDKIADAMVNQKYALAHENEIQFEFKGCITPGHRIRQSDLCALLCNALDNAIEGSMKEPDHEKRRIEMTVKRVNQYLFIDVMNNIFELPRQRGAVLMSDKTDQGIHGVGMHSMNSIVKRYNGSVTWQIKDDDFILNIVMEGYLIE